MEFLSTLSIFASTETFVYGVYFLAFLLIPILLLIAADTLEFEHVRMTYVRIFVGALLAVVVGAAFYRIYPLVSLGAALLTTFIWIRLHMGARFFDSFLMVVFGWASGALFIWSVNAVLPFFPEPAPPLQRVAIEVPLHKKSQASWTALECLEISYREALKEDPEVRFYKLTFGDGEPMRGNGLTRFCENYYLTSDGRMILATIEDESLKVQRVGSSVESNLRLYEQRRNPTVLDGPDVVSRLGQDPDFKTLSLFLARRDPDFDQEEAISFSQLAYDSAFGTYVWQARMGDVTHDGYELAFILDAETGRMMRATLLEKDASGKIIRTEKTPQ